MAMYIYIGNTLKCIINALHKAGFADADWETLAIQLNLSERLANIRYVKSCAHDIPTAILLIMCNCGILRK